jgi:cytochrome c5
VNRSLVFRVALIILLLSTLGAVAKNPAPRQQATPAKPSTAKAATTDSQEGEKRFELQCGRCHTPPEDLSPREARAVVRQMRVRANLTAEDERLILKYLAP